MPVATLNEPRRAALAAFFREGVFPVLTPLAIDVSRPFPLLASLSLNLALLLEADGDEPERRLAIVQVPAGLARLVDVSGGDGVCYVLLEDVIRAQLAQLFPGQVILESAVIRLARDAELELDDEGGHTHLEVVEREVRRRRRSDVVRLEVDSSASEELLGLLRDQLDISPEDVFAVPGPLDLRVLLGLTDLPGLDALRDPPLQPASMAAEQEHRDFFELLDERDILLHHPYEAYDPVVALIDRAADDPDVLAIKQTLYRTSIGIADHRGAAAGGGAQQAGDGPGRADRALRRGAQHPLGAGARTGGRARDLRRPPLQDAREDLPDRPPRRRPACAATCTSAPATTTNARRASTPIFR